MRTGIKLFVVFAFVILFTPFLRAANVQWPPQLGDWAAGGPQPKYVAQTIENSKRNPLLQEAGLVGVDSRVYSKGDSKAALTLYTFHDSSGAYEWFSTLVLKTKQEWDETQDAIYHSNQVLLIEKPAKEDDALQQSADKWVQTISDGVTSPPIVGYLPAKDRVGWKPYALGPVGFQSALRLTRRDDALSIVDRAGFDSHAEAAIGSYADGKNSATLVLIEYPTPQLAELHLRHLQRALADAKLTTSSIERKGSLLSIVLAPTSPEYAEKLRGSVNYETSVTWNEPSSTATDPPIMSTLVKIIIATFVFMGVTLVLGIAFGGVRVITKRLFPGKVFDRKEQIEVLQLGLSGKPIDPTDLY